MLLFSFVPFIVNASIFCLHFFQKQSVNQPKKYRGNVLLLHQKAHAKIQVLLKENKFYPKKSLTSLLHQAIQLWETESPIQRVFSGIKRFKNKELKSDCAPNSLNQLYFNWMESNSNVQCMILWSSFKWHFLQIIMATKTNFFKADVWFTSTVSPSNLSTS